MSETTHFNSGDDNVGAVEHVLGLNFNELRELLDNFGLKSGPITASTVKVYQRLLVNHLHPMKDKFCKNLLEMDTRPCLVDDNDYDDDAMDLEDSNFFNANSSSTPEYSMHSEHSESLSQRSYTPVRWDHKRHSYVHAHGEQSTHLQAKVYSYPKKQLSPFVWLVLLVVAFISLTFCILYFLPSQIDPYTQLARKVEEFVNKEEKDL